MEGKEKAKELVSKFGSYAYFTFGNNSMEREYEREDNAKQCALIAVDEILKMPFENQSERSYWQEVKQEINKL